MERAQRIHRLGRALALQDIPANLVGQIDVYKTRAAEQLETGLAGQIDVRTRRPFDLPGFELSVNARAIQQEQRDTIDPNVSVLVSNQWEVGSEGRFGALFNVSYANALSHQSITARCLQFRSRPARRPPAPRIHNCSSANLQPQLPRIWICRPRPWSARRAGLDAGFNTGTWSRELSPICSHAMR